MLQPDGPLLNDPTVRWDCRHYRGDKPCAQNRLCNGCAAYAPYRQRVCVIKLGALGDVVRTLCILPELRRQYPEAQITWVTKPNGQRLLAKHPMIDRLLVFDAVTSMQLTQEQFDLLICLDKEAEPCALANAVRATQKLGVGLSPAGTPVPLNEAAVPYFHLGLSDELKFHGNRKGYPQLVYEALGWTYRGQRYELPVDDAAAARVAELLPDGAPVLGVNVGAGEVFANKMWPAERTQRLLEALHNRRPDVRVMLLGGPGERQAMDQLHAALPWTIHSGCENDEQTFIALLDRCEVLFSGDTMAMHVAVARGKQAVVYFGPTCEQEIDLFGRGEKLVAQVACGPCYKRKCDHGDACLEAVSVGDALAALERALARVAGDRRVPLPVLKVA